MLRHFNLLDQVLIEFGHALKTTLQPADAATQQPSPADSEPETSLTENERHLSAGLMRINHSGEIAAQALYRGQALVARDITQREMLLKAANEEENHLIWCKQRLRELNDRSSHLAPLWYTGSFAIGIAAGLSGDQRSLGFIEETEIQVSAHLGEHMGRLPKADRRSHAILAQMRLEESEHAEAAKSAGAEDLPFIVKKAMSAVASIMKSLSFRL